MEVLNEKKVKTRKPHQCFACLRQFPVGTEMTAQTCKYDGRIYTVYSCATCDLLMDSLDLMDDVEMIFPEGCVRECMAEYRVDSPEQLLEATKDKTQQR